MSSYLSNAETCLRKRRVERLDGDARAVVACIFRGSSRDSVEDLEMFFILRAFDPRGSRWSGQVAFPGGHVEVKRGETDEDAVAREVKEEVGLDLKAGGHYRFLGEIEQQVVTKRDGTTLVVCCHVFEQLVAEAPVNVQVEEVAACGWARFDSLITDEFVKSLNWTPAITNNLQAMRNEESPKYSSRANNEHYHGFPSVLLPMANDLVIAANGVTEGFIRSKFTLWGLTLGLVNDLLLTTQARSEPIDRDLLAKIEEGPAGHKKNARGNRKASSL